MYFHRIIIANDKCSEKYVPILFTEFSITYEETDSVFTVV